MLRSGNPVLQGNTFTGSYAGATGDSMTIIGTVNKTLILFVLLVVAAAYSWMQFQTQTIGGGLIIGSAIGGFIVGLVIAFKRQWAPMLAPLYALLQGVLLGIISASYEMQFEGIVKQAILCTFCVMAMMLFLYRARIIAVTDNFRLGVVAATGGLALVYFVTMILSLFGISVPYIHESGTIGVLFSVGVIVIASLNLVMDFDYIEQGEAHGAPKYMEWYGGFALMVTMIWLYLEILRLLAKLNSRRN